MPQSSHGRAPPPANQSNPSRFGSCLIKTRPVGPACYKSRLSFCCSQLTVSGSVMHRGPGSRPSHGQGQLDARSGCLWCPVGTWEVRAKKRGGPEEAGRERGNGKGREGRKEGIKGVEVGWGGGQGTQEKSESSHRPVALPHSTVPPPSSLRTESSQLTLEHTIFTPLQSIVKLSFLSLSPYSTATAHTCPRSGGLEHRGLLSRLGLPIPSL